MSQSTPSPSSHGRPDVQNRRLSIIQNTAIDDLHDIDTHALDDRSPPPHHESSLMSYMESHSPNDESCHQCTPKSPLISRNNSVGDAQKMEMMLEARTVKENVPQGKEEDLARISAEPTAKSSRSGSDVKDARTPESVVDLRKEV